MKNACHTSSIQFQSSFSFICLQKERIVNENKVKFSTLDENQSYCFSVAAYIPSRKGDKRVGKWSLPKCSPQEHKTPFQGESKINTLFSTFLSLLRTITSVVGLTLFLQLFRKHRGRVLNSLLHYSLDSALICSWGVTLLAFMGQSQSAGCGGVDFTENLIMTTNLSDFILNPILCNLAFIKCSFMQDLVV